MSGGGDPFGPVTLPSDTLPQMRPPSMLPDDPGLLMHLQQLDSMMRDPRTAHDALKQIEQNLTGVVMQENALFAQKMRNADLLKQQTLAQQPVDFQERQAQRADALLMQMRTTGERVPDLEDQINSLAPDVPPETVQRLRDTANNLQFFKEIHPALATTLRKSISGVGEPGFFSSALHGATGGLVGGVGPLETMRQKASSLENAFFNQRQDSFDPSNPSTWNSQGTLNPLEISSHQYEADQAAKERSTLRDYSKVPEFQGGTPEEKQRIYDTYAPPVKVPKSIDRETFRSLAADVMSSVIGERQQHEKGQTGVLGQGYLRGVSMGEIGELVGMMAPFGAIGKAGRAAEFGVGALAKSAPAFIGKLANAGTQGLLAYEYGSKMPLSASTQTELDRMDPTHAKKVESAYREAAGVTTTAILPIMALAAAPLRPAAQVGSKAVSSVRALIGTGGLAGKVGSAAEHVAEGAVTGAALPATQELASVIQRQLPTENAHLMADRYAAQGLYGPLERLTQALKSGDSEAAQAAAREYATQLQSPMVALAGLHAMRAVHELTRPTADPRIAPILNGQQKVTTLREVTAEIDGSDLSDEAKAMLKTAAQQDLEAVSKSKAQDEPRVVQGRVEAAVGGPEAAQAAVSDRLDASRLPQHEGDTLEQKAQTIDQKLVAHGQAERPTEPEAALAHDAEGAALQDERSAVRALQRGDQERAEQLLDNATGLRKGTVDPREGAPSDEPTPASQAAVERATVEKDVAREAKGPEVGKAILAEKEAEPGWTYVRHTDDGGSVVARNKKGTHKVFPEAEWQRMQASTGGQAVEEVPRETGAAPVRPARRPRADVQAELLDHARSLRQEHGDAVVTPEFLQKSLAISKKRAQALHETVMAEAPTAPVSEEPVKVASPIADREHVPADAVQPSPVPAAPTEPTEVVKPKARASASKATTVFHGAATRINQLDEGYFSGRNIYGEGFYTTDNEKIARGYTKKNSREAGPSGKPTVYRVTEKEPVKFYDLDAPLTPEIMRVVQAAAEHSQSIGDGLAEAESGNLKTLGEVMDEARDVSRSNNESADELTEAFIGLTDRLEALGYGGFTHQGGKLTRGEPHTVQIYWHPDQQIRLEETKESSARRSKPPTLRTRADDNAVAAKVEELKARGIKDDAGAEQALQELSAVEADSQGITRNQDWKGDELARFVRAARSIVNDIRSASDWNEFVTDFGPNLRDANGQAMQFSKEGRELLAKIQKLSVQYGGETGAMPAFDVVEAVRKLWGTPADRARRIATFARTTQGAIHVATNPLDSFAEFIRTGIGRFGAIGTETIKTVDEMQSDVSHARSMLATLRKRYPQGSDRLERLVMATYAKDEGVLATATEQERQDARDTIAMLGKARVLLANYRKGVFESRLALDDLRNVRELTTRQLADAQQREADAQGQTSADADEQKLIKKEQRNATSQRKRTEERLKALDERVDTLQKLIDTKVTEWGREDYWPHVDTLTAAEHRALREHPFEGQTEPGQMQGDDGSYRAMFPEFASSGHSKERTGKLEESGRRITDSLDALHFYLADVLPKARWNKFMFDHYDDLYGKRRLLSEDELSKGFDGVAMYRPNEREFALTQVKGGYYHYETPWGPLLSKSKLTPVELATWLGKSRQFKDKLAENADEAGTTLRDYAANAKPEYVMVTQSPRAKGAPRDAFLPERIGWYERRPDVSVTPFHASRYSFWTREGGIKQQLEGLGAPGRAKWDALGGLFKLAGLHINELGGMAPRWFDKANRMMQRAILSTTLGLAQPRVVINAMLGAVFTNTRFMGLRTSMEHADLPARFLGKMLKLGKPSFHEWVEGFVPNAEANPDKPLWENQRLRDAFLKNTPQRTPDEQHQAEAMFYWATSPFYSGSVRASQWGDIGASRSRYPAFVENLPETIKKGPRAVYRAARWFLDRGQWIGWRLLESNVRSHLYMGSYVEGRRAGLSEADARRQAENVSIAAHGSFNTAMKSPLMRMPLISLFGTATNWMQHMAGTTIRLVTGGPMGTSVETPGFGGTAKGSAAHFGKGIGDLGYMWMHMIAIQQMAGLLGVNDKLQLFGRDVSRQIGMATSDLWFGGEWANEKVEDIAGHVMDGLGMTAEKFPRAHDVLSWRASDLPLPVVPMGLGSPAVTLLTSAGQWISAKMNGDDLAADRAESRLVNNSLGGWYRMYKRAFSTVPTEDPKLFKQIDPMTGRATEMVQGSGMQRLLLDLVPGTPIDESANWKDKVRDRRANDRLRAEGATTNAQLRALYREMESVQDPQRKAAAKQEFDQIIERLHQERGLTVGEYKSLVSDLKSNESREGQPGAVRDIVDAVTQEGKVRLLIQKLDDPWRPLQKSEAEWAMQHIVGHKKIVELQRELPPALFNRLDTAWTAASQRWKQQSQPALPGLQPVR